MHGGDYFFGASSVVIALVLLALMLAAMEAGHRWGRSIARRHHEGLREQAVSAQAAMLGLLALLLGFTLSIGLTRFESRSEAIVKEANAIGTAWLRTDLLSPADRQEAQALIRDYLAARIAEGRITLDHVAERDRAVAGADALGGQIWAVAARAAAGGPVPLAFATAVNDMIDAFGARDAELRRHMPEVVTKLLFLTFIGLGFVVGYSAGTGDARPSIPIYLIVVLIVVLMFLIIDLDRPRRGLIPVSQEPMLNLAADLGVTLP